MHELAGWKVIVESIPIWNKLIIDFHDTTISLELWFEVFCQRWWTLMILVDMPWTHLQVPDFLLYCVRFERTLCVLLVHNRPHALRNCPLPYVSVVNFYMPPTYRLVKKTGSLSRRSGVVLIKMLEVPEFLAACIWWLWPQMSIPALIF